MRLFRRRKELEAKVALLEKTLSGLRAFYMDERDIVKRNLISLRRDVNQVGKTLDEFIDGYKKL